MIKFIIYKICNTFSVNYYVLVDSPNHFFSSKSNCLQNTLLCWNLHHNLICIASLLGLLFMFLLLGNIAYGKTATVYGIRNRLDPSRAIDGNTNPVLNDRSCSYSYSQYSSRITWWQVDFGSLHVVINVTVYKNNGGQCLLNQFWQDFLLVTRVYSDCFSKILDSAFRANSLNIIAMNTKINAHILQRMGFCCPMFNPI